MNNPQLHDILKYPFCLSCSIEAKPEKISCPGCHAVFEIDDRVECVFANPEKLKFPRNGFVCNCCGLVQGDQVENCLYCGTKLCVTLQ